MSTINSQGHCSAQQIIDGWSNEWDLAQNMFAGDNSNRIHAWSTGSIYFGNMYYKEHVLRVLSVSRCCVDFTLSANKRIYFAGIYFVCMYIVLDFTRPGSKYHVSTSTSRNFLCLRLRRKHFGLIATSHLFRINVHSPFRVAFGILLY